MHLRINRALSKLSYKCVTNLRWTKSIYYHNNVHNIYKTQYNIQLVFTFSLWVCKNSILFYHVVDYTD